MNITFILNGEDVTIQTDAEKRLVDILREIFKLSGTKQGCYSGRCGYCSVMLNGEVVKSCLVPAFKIHKCEIVTIEGFSQTDEYQEIVRGFAKAELQTCGFCDTGKILTAEALLSKKIRPKDEEILPAFRGIKCRCTETDSLIKSIKFISEERQRRKYGSRNINA